jgi:hypothetical protein
MRGHVPTLTALARTNLVGAGIACLPIHPSAAAVGLADDRAVCSSTGSWQAVDKSCKLRGDVTEPIVISGDRLTLDCAGHAIVGSGAGNGIELQARRGVTIKNCTGQFALSTPRHGAGKGPCRKSRFNARENEYWMRNRAVRFTTQR